MRWLRVKLDTDKLLRENLRLREQLEEANRARVLAATQATRALARERYWQHTAFDLRAKLAEQEQFIAAIGEQS